MKQILFSLFLIIIFCLVPVQGFSHKVTLFAYAEGDTIIGESSFSGGRAAKHAEIIVKDATTGITFLTTVTDEQGQFSFSIPVEARQAQADLRIVLLAGEAHRNEWILKAGEYLPEGTEKQIVAKKNSLTETSISADAAHLSAAEETLIRQLVKESLAKELGPIKQMLRAQASQGPNLRDILGGVGFIFGIAGFIAYYKARKKRSSP